MVNKKIQLDFTEEGLREKIEVVQGDTGRVLLCNIVGVDMTSVSARFYAVKDSGKEIYNNCKVSKNTVTVELTEQTLAEVGTVKCQLDLRKGDQKVQSFIFVIKVTASLMAQSEYLSSSEYKVVDDLAGEVEENKNKIAELDSKKANKDDYGSPLQANTVAEMTDKKKVYVYTGSESGYTSGNWYYWNGSAWTSGGTYNSAAVETDKTLTVADKAADGQAVGQELSLLKESLGNVNEDLDNVQDIIDNLGSGGGLSSTFISALQTILTHAVFESNQSQNIQALTKYSQETLAKVTSISALYNGGPVMSGTNILSLKDNIVVTAVYDDGTQETITDYTIIGNINVGSNTLTIKYGRKTTTITVIGTDATHVYSLSNQKFEENTTIDTGIAINDQDRDFTITIDITLLSASTTYGKARMIWKNESNKSIITAMIDNGKIKFAYMDTAETEVYLGSVDSGVSGNDLFDHVYIVLRHKLGEKTLYMKFKGVNTSKKSYTNEKTITANNMKFDDAHLMIGSYNNQIQFLLNATINSLDIYYKAFSNEEVTEFIDQN